MSIRKLLLLSSLLPLLACAVGPEPASSTTTGEPPTTGEMSTTTGELSSTTDAPGELTTTGELVVCLCDGNADGLADAGTCLAVDTCGRVCDDDAPCPAGVPASAAICYRPCTVGADTCDCLALHPGGRAGWCFAPPACVGD